MQASILPLTTVERLENCQLSPSSNLSASDRRELYARLLQNSSIIDDIGAVKHIFKAPLNLPESEEIVIDESSFEDINPHLTIYRSLTVDLASKEAAGRCLVGMIISRLAFAIQKIESQFELKVDYEYRLVATGKSGPDYASDVAILFIEVSTAFISLLLSIDQFFFPPGREGEKKTDSTLSIQTADTIGLQ